MLRMVPLPRVAGEETSGAPHRARQVLEQHRRLRRERALDLEQAQLRRDAAAGREAAELAAGGEHAMAGHDDRERVLPERLADVAGEAGLAEPRGDLAVGQRRAGPIDRAIS